MALALTLPMGTKLALMTAYPVVLLASNTAGHVANAIPELADFGLFALGIIGLLIGRRMAMKRKGRGGD